MDSLQIGREGRLAIPITTTDADLCEHGRKSLAGFEWHDKPYRAQDIVMIPEYRLVYVNVRKAASSTIHDILKHEFHQQEVTCGHSKVPKTCAVYTPPRCSTLCLSNTTLRTHFFFSFVRDPFERFFSGFQQSLIHTRTIERFRMQNRTSRYAQMIRTLSNIRSTKCTYNQHLESQAMSLASPTRDGQRMVPLDFIGRVESFADDFASMLHAAEEVTGIRIPHHRMKGITRHLNTTRNRLGAPSASDLGFAALLQREIQSLRDARLDQMVRKAYEQDRVCFDYE
jgi:hypothetical protein